MIRVYHREHRGHRGAKRARLSSFLCVLCALCGYSCGYRWAPEFPKGVRPTVCVPYATGDETGALTGEVIGAINRSALMEVRQSETEFRLQLTVLSDRSETIGFRRDPQEIRGEIEKNLLASEGRRILEVEAAIYSIEPSALVWGPYHLTADADYDYVDGDSLQDLSFVSASGALTTVLPFSLGQLEPAESAQAASTSTLYTQLAKKLVDVISSEW